MNKKSKIITTIITVILLISNWTMIDIIEKHFTEWGEKMGILAFVFRMTIIVLIGALLSFLTKKMFLKDKYFEEIDEIEGKDERNIMIRRKSGFFMWKVNLILLLALMLLMIALKISVVAWLVIVIVAINIVGFVIYFEIEYKK